MATTNELFTVEKQQNEKKDKKLKLRLKLNSDVHGAFTVSMSGCRLWSRSHQHVFSSSSFSFSHEFLQQTQLCKRSSVKRVKRCENVVVTSPVTAESLWNIYVTETDESKKFFSGSINIRRSSENLNSPSERCENVVRTFTPTQPGVPSLQHRLYFRSNRDFPSFLCSLI